MNLTDYQRNLRHQIENEIKSNSSYISDGGEYFKDKHQQIYKDFFRAYGYEISIEQNDNEKTIDFITRAGLLEELYQVALESNSHRGTNTFLVEKRQKEQKKLEDIRQEQKKKEEAEIQERNNQDLRFKALRDFIITNYKVSHDRDRTFPWSMKYIEEKVINKFIPKYLGTWFFSLSLIPILFQIVTDKQIDLNKYNEDQQIELLQNIFYELIKESKIQI